VRDRFHFGGRRAWRDTRLRLTPCGTDSNDAEQQNHCKTIQIYHEINLFSSSGMRGVAFRIRDRLCTDSRYGDRTHGESGTGLNDSGHNGERFGEWCESTYARRLGNTENRRRG
jgi:hypothetical protein